jgi:hypothetical protein
MIARVRGEHDTHWGRWRPRASRQDTTAPSRQRAAAARDEPTTTEAESPRGGGRSHQRPLVRWVLALAVASVAGYLATSWAVGELSAGSALPRLPATPRAWLDAYEAAAIDSPGRVCSELFAPQLAQAYANAVHGGCESYFGQITSFSVAVRRVLQDGGTAVLELRQTVRPRDWAVVLDRRRNGWQAVDLLTGNLAR